MAVDKRNTYLRVASLITSGLLTVIHVMLFFLIQLTESHLGDYAEPLTHVEASVSILAIPIAMMIICGLNYISSTKKHAEPMIPATKLGRRQPKILNILMGVAAFFSIAGFTLGIILFFNGLSGGIPDVAIFLVMFLSSFLANLTTLAIILWDEYLVGDKTQLYIYGSLAIVLGFVCPLVGVIPFLVSQNQALLLLMAGMPLFYVLYFLRMTDDAGLKD